ncbi:hypothetical protein IAR55_002864 [Kwoniella newhampshirensis]|uniref:Uncharacterized protein n=1 Tax=Kwoniella newhampshirensis TaxID=1651941 RepID=A0AAW0YXU4_9TREE
MLNLPLPAPAPLQFVEATRDHERDEPEFEATVEVDANQPLAEAFQKVHQKFHPGDETTHRYTFMILSSDFIPVVINGSLTPAHFPKFSSDWKVIAIPRA